MNTFIIGRILDPPGIEYKSTDKFDGNVKILPQNPGKWFNDRKHFVSGVKVENWAFLNFADLDDNTCKEIQKTFYNVGRDNGLFFSKAELLRRIWGRVADTGSMIL